LGCDLMWKICVPFLPAVNSRENANILRILVRPSARRRSQFCATSKSSGIGDVAICGIGAQEPFA
jgi:hypothetical protein